MKTPFHLNNLTTDNLGIGLFKYLLYPEEKFITVNSALVRLLGYTSKREFRKLSLRDLFLDPKDKDEIFAVLKKENKARFFETQAVKKQNQHIWVAITAFRVVSRGKEYIEGIVEDISFHKEMEENLSLEKDYLQGILDHIPDAVYFKDRNNRIIKVNKFYAQGLKLNPKDIIGKTDFDFFPAIYAQKMFEDDINILNTGKPVIGKIERTILPDGRKNQVITTKIPMYDKSGRIIGTMGITRDMTNYANSEKARLTMLINALEVLGKAMGLRDPYTFIHTKNVALIAERIAKAMDWDEDRILATKLAGELHDLGKISIPLEILNKPGKLNDLEYRLIQEHVKNCYDLIKDIEFPFSLAQIIYQHHERLDGSGYPEKLEGGQILIESRILAVSDVLESMTCYRPYREALGIEKAEEELISGKGTKYDPAIVDIALSLLKENQGKAFWISEPR